MLPRSSRPDDSGWRPVWIALTNSVSVPHVPGRGTTGSSAVCASPCRGRIVTLSLASCRPRQGSSRRSRRARTPFSNRRPTACAGADPAPALAGHHTAFEDDRCDGDPRSPPKVEPNDETGPELSAELLQMTAASSYCLGHEWPI